MLLSLACLVRRQDQLAADSEDIEAILVCHAPDALDWCFTAEPHGGAVTARQSNTIEHCLTKWLPLDHARCRSDKRWALMRQLSQKQLTDCCSHHSGIIHC